LPPSPRPPEDAQARKCYVTDVGRSRPPVPPLVVQYKAGSAPVSPDDKQFYNFFYWTPSPQSHAMARPSEVSRVDGEPSDTDGMPLMTRSAVCSSRLAVEDKERLLLQSPRSLMLAAEVKSPAKKLRANLSASLDRLRKSPREGTCFNASMIASGGTNAHLHHQSARSPVCESKIDQTRDGATASEGASKSVGRELQLERALRAEKMRNEVLSRKVAMYEAHAPLLGLCVLYLAVMCVKRADSSN